MPESEGQIGVFLEVCLHVLTQLYGYRIQQRELGIFCNEVVETMQMNDEEIGNMQKIMLPEVVRLTQLIQNLLASSEGRRVLRNLPLRYCSIDCVMWLSLSCRKRQYPDLVSALRACDKSMYLQCKRIFTSPRRKKLNRDICGIIEVYLADNPIETED